MNSFTTTKITPINEQIADLLKNTREEKKLTLERVSEKLKINIKYLRYLEEGNFNKLPSGVYGKNFLKEYAFFLRLDTDDLLKLFEDETAKHENETKKNIFSRKIPKAHYFITIPKIIKNAIILTIVGLIVSYLAFSIYSLISPPSLKIINPENDITTALHSIKITGQTETEANIYINNEIVLMDKEGIFEKEINLKEGINNIEIVAQKKYSKKNIINRKILVE